MKAFIFGIAGFVGKYLTEEFLNNGYEVSGSDMKDDPALPGNVAYTKADLLNSEAVRNLILRESPDIIVNLAAISSVGLSWSIPQTTIMVNVVGPLNILEAAKDLEKKPKIMFIGSSEEYEGKNEPINEESRINANNPYGISKSTQEKFAEVYRERYGLKIYCVRAFNHTGVGQTDSFVLPSFCKQAALIEKSGKPGVIKVGNLKAKRDFSHVKDVVRAYRRIIESGDASKIYNVGSGTACGLDEMLKFIVSLSSRKIEIEIEKERFRPVDTPLICCDNSLIKKELGWEPEYTVFDALNEMFRFYCSNE